MAKKTTKMEDVRRGVRRNHLAIGEDERADERLPLEDLLMVITLVLPRGE